MKQVAALAIFNHNGLMLMGRRKDNQKWTNPGGHLEGNETKIEGAVREAKEETGLDLDPKKLEFLESRVVSTPEGKILVHGFKYVLPKGVGTTTIDDPDDEVYRWVWRRIGDKIPADMQGHLHVPDNNILFDNLGVEYKMEKQAFYIGFEKQAGLRSLGIKALRGLGNATGVRYINLANKASNKLKRTIGAKDSYVGALKRTLSKVPQSRQTRSTKRKIRNLVSRIETKKNRLNDRLNDAHKLKVRGATNMVYTGGLLGAGGLRHYLHSKHREKQAELIQGGKGDGRPDSDFNKQQLAKGVKVEKEHTSNPSIAKEIAKDHLTESPEYYKALEKMEKMIGA